MIAFILSFEPDGAGGYYVLDARSQRHHVKDERDLWQLLAQLSTDDDLPRTKVEQHNNVVGVVAGVMRRIVPNHAELVDAAEPLAHQVTAVVPVVEKYRTQWRNRKGRR